MILRTILLSFSLFLQTIYAQNFRCNQLLSPADHQNLLTFEYRSPLTKQRGVVCVAMLNGRESMVVYMEEEVGLVEIGPTKRVVIEEGTTPTETQKEKKKHKKRKSKHRTRRRVKHFLHRNKHKHHTDSTEVENASSTQPPPQYTRNFSHKQAVGRAHRSHNSPTLYTGVIHVIKNIHDQQQQDLYDLDNSPFTLNFTPETGIATLTIRSHQSASELVYIWLPRAVVHHWFMRVEIPRNCGSIKSFRIADPISQSVPDRQGIVCVLQNTPTTFKYFSLGWRRAGVDGKPRKFINFGSLLSASTNFLNIYTGRVHALDFPSPCDTKHIQADQFAFKDTLIISAVRSVNSHSLMVYGDLQELWYDPEAPIDSASPPKYPLISKNFNSDYSADLKQIYGISHFNLK